MRNATNLMETQQLERIENRTFDELKIGESATLVHTLTNKDIQLFAAMSGDVNPSHVDPAFAKDDMFHKVIAHGMWGGALISTVLGTESTDRHAQPRVLEEPIRRRSRSAESDHPLEQPSGDCGWSGGERFPEPGYYRSATSFRSDSDGVADVSRH
jgi:hypothetical protein